MSSAQFGDRIGDRLERPRPLDQLGFLRARRVVGIDERRGEVAVTHPLLKGSHRHAGTYQVVEVVFDPWRFGQAAQELGARAAADGRLPAKRRSG